ncbi:hypothetical protein NDU88_001820 [Pleurodeles waltl]|uniref:Uncharacterized protein n=1 Tax=Pleurodeles waltl TaxID=8319 RepID=A0AAV7SB58_PLEWA|nr:hypothetical protein NDU88_001820 [Pleurodeles waltl]
MLVKPSQGLQDSVPGTFPPAGPEEESQNGVSHPGVTEPELVGEASHQPIGLPAPSWCGTLEEGSAHPRAWWAWSGLMNSDMQRTASWRKGAPSPGPGEGLAGAPKSELAGEASLGPVDSEAWAPQGTAAWKKGVPAPGPSGGPARAPEPKLAGEASPGPVDSQAWAPQGTAGWRKESACPRACGSLAGAPEPKLTGEASPGPGGLPGLGSPGYGRLEERSACPRAW